MKTLETEHLILRKFTKADFTAVHNYASVSENTIYMVWGPNTAEQTQGYYSPMLANNVKKCIILKKKKISRE